jgi:hypothetical protein
MCGQAPERVDMLPAGPGVLALFLQGAGTLRLTGGVADASHCASLVTPLRTAARIELAGPWQVFGTLLSPLGWAALTGGRSAADLGNRLRDAGELLGSGCGAWRSNWPRAMPCSPLPWPNWWRGRRRCWRRVARPARAACAPGGRGGGVAGPGAIAIPGRSLSRCLLLTAPVAAAGRSLFRPAAQATRPAAARLRAAALLADPRTAPQQVASMADHFYDQSHLIREVRLVTGRTPARLAERSLPLLDAMLGLYAPPSDGRRRRPKGWPAGPARWPALRAWIGHGAGAGQGHGHAHVARDEVEQLAHARATARARHR